MCEPPSSSLPVVGSKSTLLVGSSPPSECLLDAVGLEHPFLGSNTSSRTGAASDYSLEPHEADDMLCEHRSQTTGTSSEDGTHYTDDTTHSRSTTTSPTGSSPHDNVASMLHITSEDVHNLFRKEVHLPLVASEVATGLPQALPTALKKKNDNTMWDDFDMDDAPPGCRVGVVTSPPARCQFNGYLFISHKSFDMFVTSASATTIKHAHGRGAADGIRHRHMPDMSSERDSNSDEDTKQKQTSSWSLLSSVYKWFAYSELEDEEEDPPRIDTADGWLQLWFDRLVRCASTRRWYHGLPLEHQSFMRMRIKRLLYELVLAQEKQGKPPGEGVGRRSRMVVNMQVGELARRAERAICRSNGNDSQATLERLYTQGQYRKGVDPDVILWVS
jgi:hypothetical protein